MSPDSEKTQVKNYAAIILAAGGSSRLGFPKQLLVFKGETLLQRTINAARQSNVKFVIAVLGLNQQMIQEQTDTEGVRVIRNMNWHKGMSSSICAGIKALKKTHPEADGAILMVCDQPFISPVVLNELLAIQETTGKTIAASKYDDTLGVPVLFCVNWFDELLKLEGDSGAQKIIWNNIAQVATISFPSGNIDIDTMDEFKRLM